MNTNLAFHFFAMKKSGMSFWLATLVAGGGVGGGIQRDFLRAGRGGKKELSFKTAPKWQRERERERDLTGEATTSGDGKVGILFSELPRADAHKLLDVFFLKKEECQSHSKKNPHF